MGAKIGDVVIDKTYNKKGNLAIVVGEGISQPILIDHRGGITMDKLRDYFALWDGLEVIGHIDFEKIWQEAARIADRKTEPYDDEFEVCDSRNGCYGCEHHICKLEQTEPQTCANGCKWLDQDGECTEPHGECHIEYRTEVDEPRTVPLYPMTKGADDDLIKREDAINAIEERSFAVRDWYTVKAIIRNVPSAGPNRSENPNNCETCKHEDLESYEGACDDCTDIDGRPTNYEPKTEPTEREGV